MDETPERVGSDHAQEPEDKQDYKDRPKHRCSHLTRNPWLQRLCRNWASLSSLLRRLIVDNLQMSVCAFEYTFLDIFLHLPFMDLGRCRQ